MYPAGSSAPISPVRLFVLGSFRLERDDATIHLPTRKAESLLAYLALHPEPHAREKVAALFWDDSPLVAYRAEFASKRAWRRGHHI